MKTWSKMLVGAVAATVAAAAPAQAKQGIVTVLVHDGDNAGPTAPEDQPRTNNNQLGVGAEQTVSAYLPNAAGGPTVMLLSMGSYTDLPGGPPAHRIQALCTTYKLDAMLGPVKAQQAYVTDNDGNRRRNSHRITVTPIFNGTAALIEYGYAPGNQTQVYQKVIGADCSVISEQKKILAKTNDNCAARDYNNNVVLADSPTETRVAGAAECNGNGLDDSYAYGTIIKKDAAGAITIDKYFEITTENEIERHRPSISATSTPDRMLLCGAVGDTQPPNRGARCMLIDTATNTPDDQRILWRTYLQKKQGDIYAVEPLVAPVTDAAGKVTDTFYVMWIEADLTDRNGKEKGKTRAKASVIRVSDAGMDVLVPPTYSVTTQADAAHPGLCSTSWGTSGASRGVVLQGSIVGSTSGVGRASIIAYDDVARTLKVEEEFVYADSADAAWASKFNGQNPNNQGRNYLNCLGSVPNPGYGVTGGFMADTQEILFIPSEGRYLRADGSVEDKLGLRLNVVPAWVPPANTPPTPPPPPADTGNGGNGGNGTPTDPTDPGTSNASAPSMFGCAVGGHGDATAGSLVSPCSSSSRAVGAPSKEPPMRATKLATLAAALASLALTACTGALSGTGGLPPADDDPVPPGGADAAPATGQAKALFESTMTPWLATTCAGCHAGTGTPLKFLGPGPDTEFYAAITAEPSVTGGFVPALANLLNKGQHNGGAGPALTTDQRAAATAWLQAEATERGIDPNDNGGTPTGGTPTSRELLAQFSACMTIDAWLGSQVYRWADKGSDQGQCSTCHSDGAGGYYANADENLMFEMNRYEIFIKTFFTVQVKPDGTQQVIVNATKLEAKSNTTGHPRFNPDDQYMGYLNDFYQRTMLRQQQGQCPPAGFPIPQ